MNFYLSLVVLILLLQFRRVHGAGVNVHLFYLARVTSDLDKVYEPWLRAGTYFPDALYSCQPNKSWHDFAEAAHWPQFLVRAIELWHRKYDKDSDSEDSMRLRNFLVGVFVHQVVDCSWHSLVDGYKTHGLLEVLAQIEFGGHTNEAHTFLDFMGDFIVLGKVNRDSTVDNWQFFTNVKWYLPKEEDMLDIVRCAGVDSINISYQDLNICMNRGFSGSIGEVFTFLEGRNRILNTAYEISPRAPEMIQDFWLGGEFNLVALLQNCLTTLNNLFDNSDQLNIMENLQLCGNLPLTNDLKLVQSTVILKRGMIEGFLQISPTRGLSNFGTSMALGQFKNDGQLYLAIGAPLEDGNGSIYLIPWREVIKGEMGASSEPATAMLGNNIHTFHVNGMDYLLISEPSTNSIFFYRADTLLLTICLSQKREVNRLEVKKVYDIDCDGKPDILLSSPSCDKYETGCIVIVSGRSIVPLLRHPGEAKSVALSEVFTTFLKGGPWSKPYQHFGSALGATDSFIYVTCQSLGLVLVYASPQLRSQSSPEFVLKGKDVVKASKSVLSNFEIVSSQIHGMFGKVICSWTYQGMNYVAISQHIFSVIFIYEEADGIVEFCLQLKLPIEFTPVPYSVGFGTDIKYSIQAEALFISSPGFFDGKGAIWKISMEEILRSSKFWKLNTLLINQRKHLEVSNKDSTQEGVCNFGKNLLLGPNDKLVIGVPQYNYGSLENDQLTGTVFIS